MKNLLHINLLLVLIITVGLNGCSIKSVYNQLDWLLLGMVEDFITLRDAQELDVKQRIVRLLDWHRTEQIPLYVQDLQFIKHSSVAGMSEETTAQTLALLTQRWNALKSRIAPDMAEALASVDAKQKTEIYAEIDNRNREISKEYDGLSDEERVQRIADRLVKHFERWLGDLNNEQLQIVRGQASEFRPFHDERLDFRQNWQQSFRVIMDSEFDRQTRVDRLTELFARPEIWQSPSYKEKLAHNSRLLRNLILDIGRSLTTKQQAHLDERLDDFIGLLQDIANGK